jgi:DNA-directed RNA polymerase specialized sigma24 family protein
MIGLTAFKQFIERRLATHTCIDHYQQRKKIIHYYLILVTIIVFMVVWGTSVETELHNVKKELYLFTAEQKALVESQLEVIRHLENINKDNQIALLELQRLRELFAEQTLLKKRIIQDESL